MKYTYSKTFNLSYTELDKKAGLNAINAITIVQDVMTEYFESFRSDNLRIKKNNRALWVMTKTKVVFKDEQATWLDRICASGYTIKNTPIRSYVECIVKKEGNRTLFVANQEYCVIDLNTRKLRKINTIDYPSDMEYENTAQEISFSKLDTEFSEKEFVYNQKVFYPDIDFSEHTNNVSYMKYIFNTFDSDFFNKNKITEIELHYIHESYESDLLSVYKKANENHVDFLIKCGKQEILRARMFLAK